MLLRSSSPLGSSKLNLEWWSLDDRSLRRRLSLEGDVDPEQVRVRAFNPAARLFAAGLSDGIVRVWSMRTGKILHTFGLPDHVDGHPTVRIPVNRIAISPDGSLLAAGTMGHSQVAVFSLKEDRLLYSHHVRPLYRIVDRYDDLGVLAFLGFSPDGRLLVTTDLTERGINVSDARTGRAVGQLSGHRDYTAQVAFSPDGKTLASTGGDGSVRLWHLATQRELATLYESGASSVAFSPDGSALFVGFDDEVAVLSAPTLADIDRGP